MRHLNNLTRTKLPAPAASILVKEYFLSNIMVIFGIAASVNELLQQFIVTLGNWRGHQDNTP
ncbi:MAG: hypothetical protein KJ052_06360 [Candidatus Hydrogenedentes bacterium]|nr:hypothetical protein [Candidatus Hydrogenedentota bacterium]